MQKNLLNGLASCERHHLGSIGTSLKSSINNQVSLYANPNHPEKERMVELTHNNIG
jgi:hypothetical protein